MTRAPRFTYYAVSPALAGLVAFHYVLEAGSAPFDAGLCALLGQVQIGMGGAAAYDFGGAIMAAPSAAIVGPSDVAGRLVAPAGFRAIGCGLTPAGWSRLLPVAAGQIANRVIAAETLFGSDAGRLASLCASAANDAARAGVIDGFLKARLASAAPADPRIAIIDAWVVSGGNWDVEALALQLGLSRRSLERLTASTHGSTPKRLAAKYRSLQAAGRMAVGEVTDWREAATLGGFADQSHFIREFKRFVGMTPQAFRSSPECFQAQLLRGSWEPGKRLSISIWA